MTDSIGLAGLAGVFLAGTISFLSPCVLPLVPGYLSFITGMSLEDLRSGVDRRAALTHSLLFVSGFTLIFVLMGASASFLGQFFRAYSEWITRIGGVIIIVLGLYLAGVLRLTPLDRERRLHLNDKPIGHLGTLGVGAAFAAGWTPCIGPLLGTALTLATTAEYMWAGVGYLFVYSMGLAVPFLLATLAVDAFLRGFQRFRHLLPALQVAAGVLLIVVGVMLVSGTFTLLSTYLIRFTPDFILEML